MRLRTGVSLGTIITILTFTLGAGCSDGGDASPAKVTPPRDAAVTVPDATPERAPITLIVKGRGHVEANDNSIDCGESGVLDGGGPCRPPHYGVILYAAAYLPWAFDHWEPSLSANSSLALESWTTDTVTAVFSPLPIDAGAD